MCLVEGQVLQLFASTGLHHLWLNQNRGGAPGIINTFLSLAQMCSLDVLHELHARAAPHLDLLQRLQHGKFPVGKMEIALSGAAIPAAVQEDSTITPSQLPSAMTSASSDDAMSCPASPAESQTRSPEPQASQNEPPAAVEPYPKPAAADPAAGTPVLVAAEGPEHAPGAYDAAQEQQTASGATPLSTSSKAAALVQALT